MPSNLESWMNAQPHERQTLIKAKAEQILTTLKLAEIRKNQGLSQKQLAERMNTSQENISQFENKRDVQLSTLLRYVWSLGGVLRIEIDLPNGQSVELTPNLSIDDK